MTGNGKSRKTALLVGAGVAVLLLGGGAVAASLYASAQAEEKVAAIVRDYDLGGKVRYGGVSYSLFTGTATVEDVRLVPDGQGSPEIRIGALRISGLKEGRGFPLAARVRAEDFALPLVDIARYNRGDDLYTAIGMGYTRLTGSIDVSFSIKPDDRELDMALTVEVDDIGGTSASIGLSEVDVRALEDLAAAASRDDRMTVALMGAAAAASRLELRALEIVNRDDGFNRRFRRHTMEQEFLRIDDAEAEREVRQRVTKAIMEGLDDGSLPRRDLEEIAAVFAKAAEDGGTLRIATDLPRPLPLFEAGQRGGLPALSGTFRSGRDVMEALALKITN